MFEYAKIVLLGVSFREELFRKELKKIMGWCDDSEKRVLKKYCCKKYRAMFPETIDEIFLHNDRLVFNSSKQEKTV